MPSNDELPLTGVRVLDLTRVLAGPLCTMMLGDLGADVLKIERPVVGDDTRSWGGATPLESPYFTSINRNKFSVAADFANADDRQRILALLGDADVVVDNFLPSALAKFGLDPDALLRQHPRLVWCSISGFGAGNPRPGYDFVTQAECGWMAITGEPDGEPLKVGVALADIVAGKDAAIAILAALVARHSTRKSNRRIVISLADSARAALVNVAQGAIASGTEPKRWGNAHASIVPYQLFHAKDQPIVIAVGSDSQWASLVRALKLDDLAADPSLARNPGRLAARERIVNRVEDVVKTKPAADWVATLGKAGVPVGVVKSVLQSIRDAAASPVMGMPSSVGGTWRHAPPKLDQHGDAVRREGWLVFRSPDRLIA
jgi:crotonobetainyl-CoA:carnitine CoA-transferase CaiB-like acyl-CoA transferase